MQVLLQSGATMGDGGGACIHMTGNHFKDIGVTAFGVQIEEEQRLSRLYFIAEAVDFSSKTKRKRLFLRRCSTVRLNRLIAFHSSRGKLDDCCETLVLISSSSNIKHCNILVWNKRCLFIQCPQRRLQRQCGEAKG